MKAISKNFRTAAVGTVFGGSLLFTAGLGMANAEPVPAADGLVNVTVGGTTILDSVTADVATNASAAICGSAATDISPLVEQVDTQGVDQTVCAGLPGGDLVLAQNVSYEVPEATDGTQSSDGTAEGATEGSAEGAGSAEEAPSSEDAEAPALTESG